MIVWGGWDPPNNVFNTGGKYNPDTNSWTATSTTNAPTARYVHTAVWTGSEMIVWGGFNAQLFQHRREILRAIWFADADGDSNCNSKFDCHTYGDRDSYTYCNADIYCNNNTEIYTGSAIQAYSATAPVRDAIINRKSEIWYGRKRSARRIVQRI